MIQRQKRSLMRIAEWTGTPGVVGVRVMLVAQPFEADDPGLSRIFAACAHAGVPVNVMCSGKLPLMRELARRHPETQVVVDHVGLVQPFQPPAPPEPFADLANVLSLAECDNVAIKISGACTLSHQPFPYADIWEPLSKVFDAFGFDRCMWGTDWTRAVRLLTYEQGVEAFRVTDQLSAAERSTLMGGSLTKIYNWSARNGRVGLQRSGGRRERSASAARDLPAVNAGGKSGLEETGPLVIRQHQRPHLTVLPGLAQPSDPPVDEPQD